MNCLKSTGLIFVLTIIFSISALGKTLYVASGGEGTGIGGWDDAIGDIQVAVDLADEPGDIVLVSNGTYQLAAHITVDKPITVKGFYPPEGERPLINGQNSVRGFKITHADAQVAGFTISNCAPTDMSGNGGGVYLIAGLLNDCVVVSNTASGAGGGGIYMTGGVVSNTTIKGNSCYTGNCNGGGLLVNGSPARVHGGQIADNLSNASSGGGISVNAGAMLYLDNAEVYSNYAHYGGGIYVYGKASISNCDVSFNTAAKDGGGIVINNTKGDAGGTVTHSRVTRNIASGSGADSFGGGIKIGTVTEGVLIANSEISGNKIDQIDGSLNARGGGIAADSGAVIRNCFVAHNWIKASGTKGSEGSGIFINNSAAVPNIIESCTIVSNYSFKSSGGVYLRFNGSDLVRNCIVAGNLAGAASNTVNNIYLGDAARKFCITYTCASEADGTWGDGSCINDDPLFVDPGSGNYRLQSSSPCINTGESLDWMAESTDLDGYSRLDRFSRLADMGCYELLPQGVLFRLK